MSSEHLTYLREVLEHDAIGFGEDFQFQDAIEHFEALEHASEQYRKAIKQLTNERDKAARLGKSGGYKATPEHSWAEWCDELYRDLNKANDRIKQLEAALRRIVAMTPDPEFGAFPIESAIDVARAALEGKDD